jgi:hypothetical protein
VAIRTFFVISPLTHNEHLDELRIACCQILLLQADRGYVDREIPDATPGSRPLFEFNPK